MLFRNPQIPYLNVLLAWWRLGLYFRVCVKTEIPEVSTNTSWSLISPTSSSSPILQAYVGAGFAFFTMHFTSCTTPGVFKKLFGDFSSNRRIKETHRRWSLMRVGWKGSRGRCCPGRLQWWCWPCRWRWTPHCSPPRPHCTSTDHYLSPEHNRWNLFA